MPMSADWRIDESLYLNSIHGGFKCTDCHAQSYQIYPHPVDSKFEPMLVCIDCHGGIEEFAKYHFEKIESEYLKSVHALRIDNFSCWKCHNPHDYKNVFLNTQNIKLSITTANEACLKCHVNSGKYKLYSDMKIKSFNNLHKWLPNQKLHLTNTRCIDCHSIIHDSVATPHNITVAKNAVKNCEACHSDQSRLMTSLYKYKVKESRRNYGFVNAVIINNAYVVGANRNHILNKTSIIIFSLLLFTILIHILLRIIFNKESKP
jgi:hypothetical protein